VQKGIQEGKVKADDFLSAFSNFSGAELCGKTGNNNVLKFLRNLDINEQKEYNI
jgi:hypothetical protein